MNELQKKVDMSLSINLEWVRSTMILQVTTESQYLYFHMY